MPRPKDVLDMMKARLSGEPYNAAAFELRTREAVAECVRKQVATGVRLAVEQVGTTAVTATQLRSAIEAMDLSRAVVEELP